MTRVLGCLAMRMALNGATIVMALVWPSVASAVALQVTDSAGTVVELRKAYVNYGTTQYMVGGARHDNEHDGLRVSRGEATITVKWSRIQGLVIEYAPSRFDQEEKKRYPAQLRAKITLDDGELLPTELLAGRLRGESELGDYEIDLRKVRSILKLVEGEGATAPAEKSER